MIRSLFATLVVVSWTAAQGPLSQEPSNLQVLEECI